MGQTENTILSKVAILLEKTKDALIHDLGEEFVGIKEAIANFEGASKDDKQELTAYIENSTKIVDAVFAKVGYDISHYESLNGVRNLFEQLMAITQELSECIEQMAQLSGSDEDKAQKLAELGQKVVPLIQQIVQLVRAISDMEWNNVSNDIIASGEEIGKLIKDNFLTKDFARKVLDHILMTLLKNAKSVFKDEIDFVKFSIESGIKDLTSDITELTKSIQKDINEAISDVTIEVKDIEHLMSETLNDATQLHKRLADQLKGDMQDIAKEWQGTYVKIARALSITFSVFEFLGILEEKQFTLQLPDKFKELLSKVQDTVGDVSDKIGDGAKVATEFVEAKSGDAVKAVNDTLKTTKEVTGIGVAAAGTINLQLQCVDTMMSSATTELSTGMASIAAVANGTMAEVSKYAGQAQAILGDFNKELELIKNFTYPIKINVVSWEKLGDLFTNPVGHFKALYPIDSMQDAEDLMRRIMGILHNINPDIPDFDSLKNLLEGLLRKLQQHVMNRINELREALKTAANELKKKIQEAINTIWNWFQPIVTTIRNIINTLKELALALKDKMGDVLEDVKEGMKLITDNLEEQFKEVKKGLTELSDDVKEGLKEAGKGVEEIGKTISGEIGKIEEGAKTLTTQLEQDLTKAGNTIIDGATEAAEGLEAEAKKKASELQTTFEALKKDMPKLPSLNLPKMVKDSFAVPMSNAVNKTLKEVVDIDLSSVIDFSQEVNDIKGCVKALNKDYKKLKSFKAFSGLGISEKDLAVINVDDIFKADIKMPDIAAIVQQEVLPDLNVWAYGMVTTVQTLTNPNAWKKRLDTVVAQLKAEFQSDMSNITGLISKDGAMKLLNDASSVKADLKNNINITDYINIVETAVNDIVLPDPEYFYTSFKNCILTILSKLTARIIDEVKKIKDTVNGMVDKIKAIPETIEEKVKAYIDKLEKALEDKGDTLSSSIKALIEDIISTAKAIGELANKLPDTIENLKDFFSNKLEDGLTKLKDNATDMLKQIADNFLKNLENLATEVWQRMKNEYILPFLKNIKNQIIAFVKQVIRQKIKELISALTEVKEDVEDGITGMLKKLPTLKGLIEAEQQFMKDFKPIYEATKNLPAVKEKIDSFDISNGISNLNQVPALLEAITEAAQSNTEIQKKISTLALNIQFNVDMPAVRVPIEYIVWIQNILSSTIDFVQSEMGIKEVLTLVQALYKGIPEKVKSEIAKVMPQLPALPSNEFTDLLKDVSCSYDLDNLMCNVTLLDLKTPEEDKNAEDTLEASLKLQIFIMVGRYSADVEASPQPSPEKASPQPSPEGEGAASADENDNDNENEEEEEKEDNSVPAVFFTMMLNGKVAARFSAGANHVFSLKAEGSIGEAIAIPKEGEKKNENPVTEMTVGFCLSKKDASKGVTSIFHAFGSTKGLSGMLYANFGRKTDKKNSNPANLLTTEYLDIKIGNYPQTAYILYNSKYPEDVAEFLNQKEKVDGFTAGYLGKIEDMEFVLKLRQNKFFAELLKDDISAKFSLGILYDYLKGFKMDGGYSFHLDLDCDNKKIGPLTLGNLGIDLGSLKNDFGTLHMGVGSTFSVSLGDAVTMSFENLGLGFDLNVIKKDFSLGDFDFDFKFKFPEGIGVAIDCSAVKGAALINYNDETGELFGALELDVIEKFGVSALLMLDLGIREGHFFSMVALLSTRFSPGIPLGMGFSLTAIGGVLGLQRMIDYSSVREAVHSGTLGSVFFVDDVMKHMTEMKAAAEKIFPVKKKQFFFGILGQISYEPVVKCNIGVMLQLPDPTSIIIVGTLNVSIQDTDVIKINVAFSGEIDFKKGIQFDASLYDSTIVGITLEGDMAFRLFWGGETKGFLMTIGGFHPAYKPEESMHVSDLRRLSMKLDYKVLKVGLETYMAVTSNTFQIGAHLDIKVGWSKFGIIGYAGFDALFQFDPFMFMFDIEAGMAVMVGSMKILTVDLALSLSGPKPWHANGKAAFSFLLIPIEVDFDVTWGEKQPELPNKQIEVLELFKEQIENIKNWVVDENSNRDYDVLLFEEQASETTEESEEKPKVLVLAPSGSLAFNQNAVPMEKKMDLCNNAVPTDYKKLKINMVSLNGNTREILNADEKENKTIVANAIGENLENDFAPALFKTMTNQEKLKAPSYEKYASGFTMQNDESRKVGKGKTCDLSEYDIQIGVYKTHDDSDSTTSNATLTSSAADMQSGQRVTYKKVDKSAVERFVKILDSIK